MPHPALTFLLLTLTGFSCPAQGDVLNVADTRTFSTDPSGVTFLPHRNTLLLVDSEIDETSFFAGANVFELALDGTLLNAFPMFTREPVGVTYDPSGDLLYFSNDDLRRIYQVRLTGNELQVISSFSTLPAINDPEDLAFDPTTGHLWVADGITNGTRSIYEMTTAGTLVSSFLAPPEIADPEGLAFDRRSGNLLVVSSPNRALFEVTRTGALVSLLDLTHVRLTYGHLRFKGVGIGPTSNPGDFAGASSIYLCDYGFDAVDDGRIFEYGHLGEFLPFGTGCSESSPAPTIGHVGPPRIGRTFTITAQTASSDSPAALHVDWLQQNLDIGFLFPGCVLLALPRYAFPTTTTVDGAAAADLALPGLAVLAGVDFHTQWSVLPSSGSLALSNGATIVLGRP